MIFICEYLSKFTKAVIDLVAFSVIKTVLMMLMLPPAVSYFH